jgi:hypothetical protein
MNQDKLAVVFRAAELSRRSIRAQILANQAKLAGEEPPPLAVEAEARERWAAARIEQAEKAGFRQGQFAKCCLWETTSTFRRLIYAIKGTLP